MRQSTVAALSSITVNDERLGRGFGFSRAAQEVG